MRKKLLGVLSLALFTGMLSVGCGQKGRTFPDRKCAKHGNLSLCSSCGGGKESGNRFQRIGDCL